ncbi:MAG: cytochrome ubiquinol oxidase subunit I [Phycisphaerae bacterium]|nr:cytochrome ubiquinol oxidase subunit I [Phycisphaerae bacterium]
MDRLPAFYPLNDFDPLMKGMVIGGMGIVHVFLAQFAIGGGMLLCYFQRLASGGGDPLARRFIDGYFKALVLVSFVLGALTGVGMWLTAIQVSPRTIGVMVDEFHWVWATEWTFFCLEVVAGYAFYRCGARLSDRRRMALLAMYSVAAWFSLFWINGILSWQLTPGAWVAERTVWSGFFNPGFWPSLLYRTASSMTIAALIACIVINAMPGFSSDERRALIRRASNLMLPMLFMPALAVWYFLTMPADSRSWMLGGSPAMSLFLAGAAGSSMLLGGYALVGLVRQKLYINGATATTLTALALAATACGEFVREGSRKPYTVRESLYANSITPEEVKIARVAGWARHDPYPLPDESEYPNPQLVLGGKGFRLQCSVCHTLDGANGLTHLVGTWSLEQRRMNLAMLQHTKPFMPPFAGDAEELEALVQFLGWHGAGRPRNWTMSNDAAALSSIRAWLDEAGTGPGTVPAAERQGRR